MTSRHKSMIRQHIQNGLPDDAIIKMTRSFGITQDELRALVDEVGMDIAAETKAQRMYINENATPEEVAIACGRDELWAWGIKRQIERRKEGAA